MSETGFAAAPGVEWFCHVVDLLLKPVNPLVTFIFPSGAIPAWKGNVRPQI